MQLTRDPQEIIQEQRNWLPDSKSMADRRIAQLQAQLDERSYDGLTFATMSLSFLAEYYGARGVVAQADGTGGKGGCIPLADASFLGRKNQRCVIGQARVSRVACTSKKPYQSSFPCSLSRFCFFRDGRTMGRSCNDRSTQILASYRPQDNRDIA